MRPTIYISGPVTRGNKLRNYYRFCDAFEKLIAMGFAPMNPGQSIVHPGAFEIPHETWLEIDIPWVLSADCVLRLQGSSAGADKECEAARLHGIPTFESLTEAEAWLKLNAIRKNATS